ncbi:ATP-binding cassette domain-containing protein [Blastococcus colisei]|uniref:ATP-binding cassette domain-containing protein n=1 Tax=Blastococcus colisei TaxID=1564162 RepID=UPI0024825187|nr:ATP-binding cassette domain-containing protein [Blastococcus colisei]
MIHARAIRKRKREVRAVVGVDLDVEAGEIVGFLGPNAAGKTTTLRMLTTLLEPTAGTATVAGCDLMTDPVGRGRQLFRELDLDGLWERQPKAMSGGQRRRLDIAIGLIQRSRRSRTRWR